MSRIYRGRICADDTPVIIKVPGADLPTPRQLARLRYEYETLKALDLPGVIRCRALESHDRQLALVLEDAGGVDLRRALTSGSVPLRAFLGIAISLAEALGYVHEAGIIHKNITPSNILVSSDGGIRLIDFAIASRLPREVQEIKAPGLLEGTIAYISPEQTGRMNRAVDYRSDFYSLGMTFYELLTGRTAFVNQDPIEVIYGHLAQQPAHPSKINPDVPEVISDIVLKLLSKAPEARYQSAYGLRCDLTACLKELVHHGAVRAFPVGQGDLSRKLQIPPKLYGREHEIATLMTAFDNVCRGGTELVLVGGYSGVGKSSLVNEVHRPIVQSHGYFVSGKFDQYKRGSPYESIIQAFRQLIRQIMLESEARVTAWRTRLRDALGMYGRAIADVIPEITLVIGPQPPLPEVGSVEARNRFNSSFQNFVGAFAQNGQPLVIFLDDLQWCDAASLNLLEYLLTNSDIRNLLVIGAYRDNEVDATHPLMITLDAIQKASVTPVRSITLQPLALRHVRQLVAETVRHSEADVQVFAELLEQKTHGNPFFLGQLLTGLYQAELLRFNHIAGVWTWDVDKIRHAGITDNVVELMVGKISQLSPRGQRVLQLAACTGNRFDLAVVAAVDGRTPAETATDLWEALVEGLILPMDESYRLPEIAAALVDRGADRHAVAYRFLHDRVQQSAFSMIPEEERKAIRLRLARILLRSTEDGSAEDADLEKQIFEIVGHFSAGIDLVAAPAERIEIAQLALLAGKRARASTAYDAAVKSLSFGMSLLPPACWLEQYQLAFDLHLELSQCEYLLGHFDRADALFDVLLARAKTDLEKAEVLGVRIVLYENASKFSEALRSGAEALRLFGLEIDEHPSEEQIDQLISEVKAHVAGRAIHDLLHAPPTEDAKTLALSRVLLSLITPAIFIEINVFRAVVSHLALVTIRGGNSVYAPAGYVWFGVVLADHGEHSAGWEFGRLAYDLVERYPSIEIRGKVNLLFGDFLNFRKNNIKDDIGYLFAGFQSCLEAGDLTYASYCANHISSCWLFSGKNLHEISVDISKWMEFCRKVKSMEAADCINIMKLSADALIGRTLSPTTFSDESGFSEASLEADLLLNRSAAPQAYYYLFKSFVNYIFLEDHQAYKDIQECAERSWALRGMIHLEECNFYQSIIFARVHDTASEGDRGRLIDKIKSNQKKLGNLAACAPMNFIHKHILVEAEVARIEGDDWTATSFYDRAITSAAEHGYTQIAAISSECAGRFHLARGRVALARAHLNEASRYYLEWGSQPKVRQLIEKYPALVHAQVLAAQHEHDASLLHSAQDGLDLLAVTRASQAISGEIHRDRLLGQLMKILVENAGAERGFIVLHQAGQLSVEAARPSSSQPVQVLQGVRLAGYSELSEAIVRYVARTCEVVVLSNAAAEGAYATDPYIASRRVKSLVCLPIVNQDKLVGVVYLENNLAEGCFTMDRLTVLRILTTQIAISIDNANLYANLEDKVRERTGELRQAQARLVALEKIEIEQQMAGGFAHEMRNALAGSKTLVSKALGSNGTASSESMPQINVRQLQEIYVRLGDALGRDELGHFKPFIRNIYENEEFLEDMLRLVDKALSRGLAITKEIMDYAKTGREETSLDTVNLNTVVDEVRDELAREFAQEGVRLDVDTEDAASRVLGSEAYIQSIARNIILNARDALLCPQARSVTERRIQVSTRRVQDSVCLMVTDNGVGISPENLPRIFEPFFSTKPEHGTGLGLALVKKVVGLCGGRIAVRSEVGKGATFEVTFRVAEEDGRGEVHR